MHACKFTREEREKKRYEGFVALLTEAWRFCDAWITTGTALSDNAVQFSLAALARPHPFHQTEGEEAVHDALLLWIGRPIKPKLLGSCWGS